MSKSQVPNSLLGKSHTRTDSLNNFFKPGPHSHRAFGNPTANLLYPGMYHFEACKINCFSVLGESSYFVPDRTELDFCFLHINTQIFFPSRSSEAAMRDLNEPPGSSAVLHVIRGRHRTLPRVAGLQQRRWREELGRGFSFTSVGFARRHKPLLSSTDLLGRFVSKRAHL